MASAWGHSFGFSWGNSFGSNEIVVDIKYGGAKTTYEFKEYNEEDDEEMIIMAITQQLIEMRFI